MSRLCLIPLALLFVALVAIRRTRLHSIEPR